MPGFLEDLTTLQIVAVLAGAWLAYLLPLAVWIIMQRREPEATLSWLLALAALPYIGFLIYYLLGPQRIKRRALKRHRSYAALKQARQALSDTDLEARQLSSLAEQIGGFPVTSCTSAELLVDGVQTFDALCSAIEQAEHHIHVEYYIFEPDQIGTRIRDALIARAKDGIRVRLLVDAIGGMWLRRRFLRPLERAGVEFAWFHPTRAVRLLHLRRPRVNMRTHRKIVVIDGRLGFTGSVNIADCHDESLDCGRFHDLHLRLQGPVVSSLQLAFLEDWHYATGVALRDDKFWPDLDAGTMLAQVLPSGPDSRWEPIHRMKVELIHQAQQRVWLVTPYFVPGEAALFALTSAAMRGLDVRLLIPKPRFNDMRLAAAAARSWYDELLAAGVTIYEYCDRMTHAKAMLVDDDEAIVGSANFDHRSFRLNFELSIRFHDPGFVRTLEAQLCRDFADSEKVNPDHIRGPFPQRFLDACARLLSPVL